jgi:hypothetical protein
MIPMLVDTGGDQCIFATELAGQVGINLPLDTGPSHRVVGFGGSMTATEHRVFVVLPQLSLRFDVRARFGSFENSINGVLGYAGFLSWFDLRFSFQETFQILEVRSKPPYGGIPA